mmetsp:Transcript_10293/g.15722  ORF Transcript_10293/g.15722 Transcript_10293/m.15722 type:complete len:111 (-) Transcript_10293:760-1092(-)
MAVFNVLGIYLVFLYATISNCNPGRIEDEKEKEFLNQRFGRLFQELKAQQAEREGITFDKFDDCRNFLPRTKREQPFADAFDAMVFNNYFDPAEFINFKMRDDRELKFCE